MSEGTSRRDRGRRSDRRSNYDDYGYEEEATPDGYEREVISHRCYWMSTNLISMQR